MINYFQRNGPGQSSLKSPADGGNKPATTTTKKKEARRRLEMRETRKERTKKDNEPELRPITSSNPA